MAKPLRTADQLENLVREELQRHKGFEDAAACHRGFRIERVKHQPHPNEPNLCPPFDWEIAFRHTEADAVVRQIQLRYDLEG